MRLLLRVLSGLVLGLVLALPARSAHAAEGAWGWPVDPHRVARGFEPPAHDWLPGHRGVDLVAPAGSVIRSAGAGTVAYAGVIAGAGVVAVRHPDGLETTYEPVTAAVRRGQRVVLGQRLGTLQPGGHCSPIACLHWGLRRGSTYLDPLALVGAGRVRLLPVVPDGRASGWNPAAGAATAGSSALALAWVGRRRRRRGPTENGVCAPRVDDG